MVNINGLMVKCIKGNEEIIKEMVKGNFYGRMGKNLLENLKMINEKEMVKYK